MSRRKPLQAYWTSCMPPPKPKAAKAFRILAAVKGSETRMKTEKTFRPDRILSYFRAEWLPLVLVTLSGLLYNVGLLATPWFEGDISGSVTPIARVTNPVKVVSDVKAYYNISPTLMFPINIEAEEEPYALPVYMDDMGHLFILLSQAFAWFLKDSMNYGTSSEY